jgi:hypothetical protein
MSFMRDKKTIYVRSSTKMQEPDLDQNHRNGKFQMGTKTSELDTSVPSVGGDDAGRTIFNLRVDVEDVDLTLGSSLLLVEVGHHLLDPGEGLLQQLYILRAHPHPDIAILLIHSAFNAYQAVFQIRIGSEFNQVSGSGFRRGKK